MPASRLKRPIGASQVAGRAAQILVPEFAPQKGVQIETDPKATAAVSANQDDESVIEGLIAKLEVCHFQICSAKAKNTECPAS